MAYTQTTLGQLIAALALRLSDTTYQFWTQGEMRNYIKEALYTWQAMAAVYTSEVSFSTTPLVSFYDLFSAVPSIAPTITDRDLIVQIQDMLMEPESATSWTGTAQFSYSEVVQAIQLRRDKLIVETGLVLNTYTPSTSTWDTSIALDQSVVDVRRAMWRAYIGGEYLQWNLLWRADQFILGVEGTQAPAATPTDFATALEVPVSMLIQPPATSDGQLHLLTTNTGADLNPAVSATVLGIPDQFCWIVKWGALADLFSQDGPGQDRERAAYCESRWRDGIKLIRISNLVKFGAIDGAPAFVDSVFDLDSTDPTWLTALPGSTASLGVAGNILGVGPVPDSSSTISLKVSFMPMPATDGDYIQIGKEVLDAVVDYAEHLAQVKEGTSEINSTMDLYKGFVMLAATFNSRLRAAAQNFDVLSNRSLREGKQRPRLTSDLPLGELDYQENQ